MNKSLMPVDDALAAVLAGAEPLREETIRIEDAHHRTLAQDVAATRTQPPAAMSAMDGYAVRAADAALGARLKVIGEVAAGRPFEASVNAGEAVRIFTGGVVPNGSDAVVIQEDAARDGEIVTINEAAVPSKNIRATGIDFKLGDVLLQKGMRLSDRALSLAAAMNHPSLSVYARPKVALLATGDELVMPGTIPGPGQIVCSNVFALRALAHHEGADVLDLGITGDTIEETAKAIRRARDAGTDILITTGGASVGDHDVVKRALEAEGVEMGFWRIALRPGKPMMFGQLGSMRVIGLPGNPVSSYICAFLFMVPLIRKLSGRKDLDHRIEKATLGRALPANDQRQDYLRARLSLASDGSYVATPVAHQDSSLLANLAAAQALIVRAPHADAAPEASACDIMRLPV